jgi:hypothetical protein
VSASDLSKAPPPVRDNLARTAQLQTKDVSWKLFACWARRISLLYCFVICPTSCRFWLAVDRPKMGSDGFPML